MRKKFTILIIFMMLITSLIGHRIPVRAEEETGNGEGNPSDTEVLTEDGEGDDGSGGDVIITGDPADNGEGGGDGGEVVPGEGGEVNPGEGGDGGEVNPGEGGDGGEINPGEGGEVVPGEGGDNVEPGEIGDTNDLNDPDPTDDPELIEGEDLEEDELLEEDLINEKGLRGSAPNPCKAYFYVRYGGTNMAIRPVLLIGREGDSVCDTDAWMSAFKNNRGTAYVKFINSDGEEVIRYYSGGTTWKYARYLDTFMYFTHNHAIGIDLRKLVDDKVPSGTYTLVFVVPNYNDYSVPNVNIASLATQYNVTNANALRYAQLCLDGPDVFDVYWDAQGNLIIDSPDKEWLQSLVKTKYSYTNPVDPEFSQPVTPVTVGGGYVDLNGVRLQNTGTINKNGPLSSINTLPNYSYDPEVLVYDETNGYVIVTSETLAAKGLSANGHIYAELSGEGYLPVSVEPEPVPYDANNVSVSVNAAGNIVIESTGENAEEFIEYLANVNDKNHAYVQITQDNTVKKVYGAGIEMQDANHAVVTSAAIKTAFNNQLSGDVTLVIKSQGFEAVSGKTAYLPYIISATAGDNGTATLLNISKTYKVNAHSGDTVQWTVTKDGASVANGLYTTNGNQLTITPDEVGNYTLTAVVGGITDSRTITASVQGLIIESTAAYDRFETYVGAHVNIPIVAYVKNSDGTRTYFNDYLTYTSEDDAKVSVTEDGIVEPHQFGSVVLTASLGDKSATVRCIVYTVPKDATLDIKFKKVSDGSIVPNNALVAGESYQAVVFYKDNGVDVETSPVQHHHDSPGQTDVDFQVVTFAGGGGLVAIAGDTIVGNDFGTASITATVKMNKQSNKTVSKSITVIPEPFTELTDISVSGVNASDTQTIDGVLNIFLSNSDIGKSYPIVVKGLCDGAEKQIPYSQLKFVSSDATAVAVGTDGKATIKKAGEVTVSFTTVNNPYMLTGEVVFRILDLSPRLSTNRITMDKYELGGQRVEIRSAYVNSDFADRADRVLDVHFAEDNGFFAAFNPGDNYFTVEIPDNKVDTVKSGKQTLVVLTESRNTEDTAYRFDFTITVTAKLPVVTVKTSGQFNTFTNENTLALECTPKGDYIIDTVTFENNWAYLWSNGTTVGLYQNETGKYTNSGNILITFTNSRAVIKKRVSFTVSAAKPIVRPDNPTIVIYATENVTSPKNVEFKLVNSKKEVYTGGTVLVNGVQTPMSSNGTIKVTLNDLVSQTMTVSLQQYGWTAPIETKLTINVRNTLPTAKLSATSVTLNNRHERSATVYVSTAYTGETVCRVEAVRTDTLPGDLAIDNVKGRFTIGSPHLGEPDAGTYKLSLTAYIDVNGEEVALKPVTLTVRVTDDDPKVTLKNATVTLNSNYNEEIVDVVTVKGYGYNRIASVAATPDSGVDDIANIFVGTDGNLHIKIKDGLGFVPANGTYRYLITPTFDNGLQSHTPFRLNVRITNLAVRANVALKGSLNQLDLSTYVEGTVRFTNLNAKVLSANINNSKLSVSVVDGKLHIRLLDDSIADQTIPANLTLTTDAGVIITTVNIRVARKAPTVKLDKTAINVYDMTNPGIIDTINVVLNNGDPETDVEIDSARTEIINPASAAYKVTLVGTQIKVELVDGSKVKAGSSQTVTVKLNWVGDDVTKPKTVTVRFTIKDVSGTIKPKN